jgi:hypothetical protein
MLNYPNILKTTVDQESFEFYRYLFFFLFFGSHSQFAEELRGGSKQDRCQGNCPHWYFLEKRKERVLVKHFMLVLCF